jgi:ACS family hexuronate transporter-like MFS transporter
MDGGRPIGAAIAAADAAARSPARATSGKMTHVRWVICALLFFATTINYVDRGVLGVLAPELQKTFKWTDTQYGDINFAFTLAYAISE